LGGGVQAVLGGEDHVGREPGAREQIEQVDEPAIDRRRVGQDTERPPAQKSERARSTPPPQGGRTVEPGRDAQQALGTAALGAARIADPRLELAGGLGEVLIAILDAEGEVERLDQPDLERPDAVDGEGELLILKPAGAEGAQRVGAERGIDGVLDAVVECIPSPAGRQVPVDAPGRATKAAVDVVVVDVGRDQREEAVGVDGQNIVGVVERTRGRGRLGILVDEAAERIGFPASPEIKARIGPDRTALDLCPRRTALGQ
jgi:hypothetical protein